MEAGNLHRNRHFTRIDWGYIFALIFICIMVFGLHPNARGLWVLDEVRYGDAVRSLLRSGNIFTPHINGEVYPDKPPLFFWYAGLLGAVTGTIEPPLFFIATSITGIACAVAVFVLGRFLYDNRVAFISSIIMITSLLYIGIAQFVRMDLMMLFFLVLAFYYFCKARETRRAGDYYLIYIFLALSVLTKGPVGVFIFLVATCGFLIRRGRRGEIRAMMPFRGTAIILSIVGIWLLLTIRESGTEYVRLVFVEQLLGRAKQSWIHAQPVYYYLMWFPITLLPWTAYIPRGITQAWSGNDDSGSLMLWWLGSALAILSIISYKIFIYILLFIPAVALMTGKAMDKAIFRGDRSISRPNIANGVLLIFLGLIAFIPWLYYMLSSPETSTGRIAQSMAYAHHSWSLLPIVALCVLAGVAVIYFSNKRRQKTVFISIAVFIGLLSNYLMLFVVPRFDDDMSPRKYCGQIAIHLDKGFAAAAYRVEFGILSYYAASGIPRLNTLEEMQEFLDRNPRAVIAITENHWKLNAAHLKTVEIVYRDFITGRSPERTYFLLRQDSEELRPVIDEMKRLADDGYSSALYKNKLNFLRHYLDGNLRVIGRQRTLQSFLAENEKAAFIIEEHDYISENDHPLFKGLEAGPAIPFAYNSYRLIFRPVADE